MEAYVGVDVHSKRSVFADRTQDIAETLQPPTILLGEDRSLAYFSPSTALMSRAAWSTRMTSTPRSRARGR